MILELGTTALPTGAQVRSVVLRARGNSATGSILRWALGVAGSAFGWDTYTFPNSTIVTLTGTARATRPDGNVWTQADIDALQAHYMSPPGASGGTKSVGVQELYADVLYNERPVATATAPTGTIANTTRPQVAWTYSDPEGDAQERSRVKVFSAAQYGAGGFDPETSTPVYDSGEVYGAGTTHDLDADLDNNTTFRAYVKTADVGSGGRYSAWSFIQFSIAVTPPPAPSLTITNQQTDATGPRTRLQIVRTANAIPTTYMIIEYSDDAGVTWKTLRDASKILNSPDGTTFTFYDYESPPRKVRQYRSKAVRTV